MRMVTMMRMVMALMTLLELAADAAAFRSVVTCACASLDDEHNKNEKKNYSSSSKGSSSSLLMQLLSVW